MYFNNSRNLSETIKAKQQYWVIKFTVIMTKAIFFQTILAVICLKISCISFDNKYTYLDFQRQFNRVTAPELRAKRESAFAQNLQFINARREAGQQVNLNQFADWHDELKKQFFQYQPTQDQYSNSGLPTLELSGFLPSSFDYRNYGKVTPVEDPGKCGQSWAYPATALYQSLILIHQNKRHDLSQAFLLACTQGVTCNEGSPVQILKNIIMERGIPAEKEDNIGMYMSQDYCEKESSIKLGLPIQEIKLFMTLEKDEQLKEQIYSHGPVIAGVWGSQKGFLFPDRDGNINNCQRTTLEDIDHAVLVIGWTQTHWIIKNSFGNWWGDDGFAKVSRSNNCGLRYYIASVHVNKFSLAAQEYGSKKNFKLYLKDSHGDGWNGNILGIRQNGKVVSIFGDDFKSGSELGPIPIQLKYGQFAQIVVIKLGQKTEEVGFSIISQNDMQQVFKRDSGSSFDQSIVFHYFCVGCDGNQGELESVYITLQDKIGDGWGGNQLSLVQNGIHTPFGQGFTNGKNYGPIKINLMRKVNTLIKSFKYSVSSSQIGFQIRNSNGALLQQRKSGNSYSPDQILGTFCIGCVNLMVQNFQMSPKQEIEVAQEDSSQQKPINVLFFIGIFGGVILFVLFVVIILLILKKRRQRALSKQGNQKRTHTSQTIESMDHVYSTKNIIIDEPPRRPSTSSNMSNLSFSMDIPK